jgi:hypothetical protein
VRVGAEAELVHGAQKEGARPKQRFAGRAKTVNGCCNAAAQH